MLPRPDVAPSSRAGSVSESSPVLVTTVSVPGSQSTTAPVLSRASWAEIVDHIEVPGDPPVTTPVAMASATPTTRSTTRPPLPPRPPGRVTRRKPARITDAAASTRKPTQPLRVLAPPSQKSSSADVAALNTPLPNDSEDVMETEESSRKRKDPPC